jgi:hypothetical protein
MTNCLYNDFKIEVVDEHVVGEFSKIVGKQKNLEIAICRIGLILLSMYTRYILTYCLFALRITL